MLQHRAAPLAAALLLCTALGCIQAPPAPQSLSAAGSNGRISLNWAGTVGSTFLLLRAERSGGPYEQVYAGTDAFYSDPLSPLATRYYVVRAENRGGTSGFSNEAFATTAPDAPRNVKVTPVLGGALLQWDPAEGASSYVVLRAKGTGPYAVVASALTETRFADNGLLDGQEYAWQVEASGAGGPGAPSAAAHGMTAPPAATGLGGVSRNGLVLLHWQPVAGAIGYRVSRAPAGADFALLATIQGTTYADPAPGPAPVRYQVQSVGPGGPGGANAFQWNGDGDGDWVIAHGNITWVSDTGEEVRPMDFTTDQWSIAQKDPSGAWQRFPGYGTNDGYLLFLNVPAGGYLLERIRPGYPMPYLTAADARDLDLSHTEMGRADSGLVTDSKTGVQVALSGLTPWHADVAGNGSGDWLELFSQGGDLDAQNDQNLAEGTTAGSTSMTVAPWYNGFARSAAGDVTWLTQSSLRTTPEGGYFAALSAYWTGALTLQPGALTPLQAALQPAPQHSATLQLQGSQFAALSPEMASDSQPMFWDTVYQFVLPGAQKHGFYLVGPTLLTLEDVRWIPGFQDSDRAIPLTWGDPFPADWTRFGQLTVEYRKTVKAPGATTGFPAFSRLTQMDDWDTFSTTPLVPRLTGVQQVTAGGAPLGDALVSGVGLTPVLTWQAPRVGTPTTYSVSVHALAASASGATTSTTVFLLWTSATQVQIPSGYLHPGVVYTVSVGATTPGFSGDGVPRTPRSTVLHASSSLVMAGTFQP